MPKVSKASASVVKDFGVAEDRSDTADDHTIEFVTIREDHSLDSMLASLPGGHCSCPHWGYVFKGSITVRYGDREETYGAGDAYYMTPGHVPSATAGTEFVQFSPTAEFAATEAAIMQGMQSQQS